MYNDATLNTLRALGLFLVVAGHIYGGLTGSVIFLFHMPFFFFLSGTLFCPQQPGKYFLKKIIHLMLPYLAYLLLFNIDMIVGSVCDIVQYPDREAFEIVGRYFKDQFYGGINLVGIVGIFWFISCLFFTQQFYNLLAQNRFFRESGKVGADLSPDFLPHPIFHWVIAFCYVAALGNKYFCPRVAFPLGVNVCLSAIVFFHLGYCAKVYLKPSFSFPSGGFLAGFFSRLTPQWRLLASGAISFLGVCLLIQGVPVNMDMKHAGYGFPVLSVVIALAFIYLLVRLARALSRCTLLAVLCGAVAPASMTIMFWHQLIHLKVLPLLEISSEFLQTLVCFCVPLLVHLLLKELTFFKIIFLGDFAAWEKWGSARRQRF